jgi:hypothetical protein
MKVTPVGRKFGKYAPGDVFTLPNKAAKMWIKVGKLAQAKDDAPVSNPFYATRMLEAAPVAPVVTRATDHAPEATGEDEETVYVSISDIVSNDDEAPWGRKADGTPRKRPGRPAASE